MEKYSLTRRNLLKYSYCRIQYKRCIVDNFWRKIREYLTSAECAEKWNVSQRWVAIYCKEGRIEGAVLRGRMWLIPADAEKPVDPRKARKNEQ